MEHGGRGPLGSAAVPHSSGLLDSSGLLSAAPRAPQSSARVRVTRWRTDSSATSATSS